MCPSHCFRTLRIRICQPTLTTIQSSHRHPILRLRQPSQTSSFGPPLHNRQRNVSTSQGPSPRSRIRTRRLPYPRPLRLSPHVLKAASRPHPRSPFIFDHPRAFSFESISIDAEYLPSDHSEPELVTSTLIHSNLDQPLRAQSPSSDSQHRLPADYVPSPSGFELPPVVSASSAPVLSPLAFSDSESESIPTSASTTDTTLFSPSELEFLAPASLVDFVSLNHSELQSTPIPASLFDIVSLSASEITLSQQHEDTVPFLSAPLELSHEEPALPSPMPHQFKVTTQLVSATLLQYLVPQVFIFGCQEPSLIFKSSSTLPPSFLSSSSSPPRLFGSDLTQFHFALTLVLFSTLLISATLSTRARKLRDKNEDFGNPSSQFSTPKTRDDFMHWPWLTLYTPHATHLVFDQGGLALKLKPTHDAAHEYEPKTRVAFNVAMLPTPVLAINLTTFSSKTPEFFFCLEGA